MANNDIELKTVLIAKEMQLADNTRLAELLRQYSDVFALLFEDMKGLNPAFYQDQINLHKDAKPIQLRRYGLNPDYAVKVKEEIDKLF